MKTLYESILKSVGSGKARIIDIIKCPEENNIDALNEIWSSLNLQYDFNGCTSEWKYTGINNAGFYIESPDKKHSRQICLIGKWGLNDMVIDLYDREDDVKKEDLIKWVEKVAKVLDMNIKKKKNIIYLNFN